MNTLTQLWVFDSDTGDKYKLDLYENEPIKLTFIADNLNDIPTINASYSQSFRIPATNNNDQFFQHWWNPNINDFDITKKVSAELITSSGFFIDGQLRLERVFKNNDFDLIDYEVLFIGEIRDFVTQVGEGFMNTLQFPELEHQLNLSTIETSWLADPLNPAVGLFGGDIVYPLVEYGYDYDDDGVVQNNMIKASGYRAFTNSATPLSVNQFRPWIRVKAIVDKIFSLTDYTYTSSFFNTELFKNLYTNATGNVATTDTSELYATNLMSVVSPETTYSTANGGGDILEWPLVNFDIGNNWDGNSYLVPTDGNLISYIFNGNISGQVNFVFISGIGAWPQVDLNLFAIVNGTPYQIAKFDNSPALPTVPFSLSGNLTFDGSTPVPSYPSTTLPVLMEGDVVRFGIQTVHLNPPPVLSFETVVTTSTLSVVQAPASVNPGILLSDKVKIVDFFKSILKKFRLVMVPDRDNTKNFIIEPWNDYIDGGDRLDWTHKLDGNKDIQFEPVFFTQTALFKFTDQEDTDYANQDNQNVFKEAYGTRILDSNNELLTGETVVETQFAPTPVERVNEWGSTNFIIPKLAQLEPFSATGGVANASVGLIKPIVAKPRLLFWNGMKTNGFPGWYLQNTTNRTQYPQMSYVSQFPPTSSSVNLNWEIETPRWVQPPDGLLGVDVYTKYWQDYIESIYSSEARKMTAYFILDTQDLSVKFNDSIFIKDSWWRILKIYDAPVEGINSVKVDLIKRPTLPAAGCRCVKYFITDNRMNPEEPYEINYIDCEGEADTTSVFGNTIELCACELPSIEDPNIILTVTTQLCEAEPEEPVITEIVYNNESEDDGQIWVYTSTDGTTWNLLDQFIVDANSAGEVQVTVESGEFLQLGWSNETEVESQDVEVEFYQDSNLLNSASFTSSSTEVIPTTQIVPVTVGSVWSALVTAVPPLELFVWVYRTASQIVGQEFAETFVLTANQSYVNPSSLWQVNRLIDNPGADVTFSKIVLNGEVRIIDSPGTDLPGPFKVTVIGSPGYLADTTVGWPTTISPSYQLFSQEWSNVTWTSGNRLIFQLINEPPVEKNVELINVDVKFYL